jgi:DNA-binding MarR family transcriptional regulator
MIFMRHPDAARAMTAECLCFRARRASRAITRLYDEALRPVGLHATQLTLLSAIAMGGADGQPMRRLTDVLAMDLTTLSRNLGPLAREGLIVLDRLQGDRRVRIARLTPAGADRLDAARPLWDRAHRQVVDALGPDLARALEASLDAAWAATRRSAPEPGRRAEPGEA